MSAPVHPRLAPLADRLRRLGVPALALDLSALGGVLVSEGIAPDLLASLIGMVEAQMTEVRKLRGEVRELGAEVAHLEAGGTPRPKGMGR